jgi:peptidylprolyl isomerase
MNFDRRALFGAFAGTLLVGAALLPLAQPATAAPAPAADPAHQIVLTTKDGKVVIQLRPDLAPNHVKQIETLVSQKFYDGIVFHRVIEDFMAQTGDPTGTGGGGSKLPDLKAEFTDEPYVRGTVGMARTQDPDSANSQFFITFGKVSSLNGKYTVVGQVISGMDVVDKIKKGSNAANGKVTDPDKIITLRMANDTPVKAAKPVTPVKPAK